MKDGDLRNLHLVGEGKLTLSNSQLLGDLQHIIAQVQEGDLRKKGDSVGDTGTSFAGFRPLRARVGDLVVDGDLVNTDMEESSTSRKCQSFIAPTASQTTYAWMQVPLKKLGFAQASWTAGFSVPDLSFL